jgi:hypothetical protein
LFFLLAIGAGFKWFAPAAHDKRAALVGHQVANGVVGDVEQLRNLAAREALVFVQRAHGVDDGIGDLRAMVRLTAAQPALVDSYQISAMGLHYPPSRRRFFGGRFGGGGGSRFGSDAGSSGEASRSLSHACISALAMARQ